MDTNRCATLLLDAGADPKVRSEGAVSSEDPDHFSPLNLALDDCTYNLLPGEDTEYVLNRMIRSSHVALMGSTIDGVEQSVLLFALGRLSQPPLRIVKELLDMGCDVNETAVNIPTIPNGWSCLFLQVLRARHPGNSLEVEMTRFLIRQRANIFAKDGSGLTIFDHLNAFPTNGYRQDLWYCALQREGIDTGQAIEKYSRVAEYDLYYTPEHFRALCYLDSWTDDNLSRQVHDTLEACPWTEEEISAFSRVHDEDLEAEMRRWRERRRRRSLGRETRRMDEMVEEDRCTVMTALAQIEYLSTRDIQDIFLTAHAERL